MRPGQTRPTLEQLMRPSGSLSLPLVSIGLPVYNGAPLVAEALETLLAQDYDHVEIIISDNASTDETAAVCADFACKDPRIRYMRQPVNRGATWNFNHVFEQANGTYFMWAAHDDLWLPQFLSACVDLMEADKTIAICHSEGQPCGSNGEPVGQPYVGMTNQSPDVRERWRQMVERWELHAAIYGLMRSEFVARTRLLPLMPAGETVFLTEMAVQGQIAQVPAPLQLKRVPSGDERYHTRLEMFSYLGGRAGLKVSLQPLRLRVCLECLRGLARLGITPAQRRHFAADAARIYLGQRYWRVDMMESVESILGPTRYARWRSRALSWRE